MMLSNQIAVSRINHLDTRLVCIQSSVGIAEEEVIHIRIELFMDEIFCCFLDNTVINVLFCFISGALLWLGRLGIVLC